MRATIFFIGVVLMLAGNHVVAYFPVFDSYQGWPRAVIYNSVRLSIYVVIGYASVAHFSYGKIRLFLLSIAIFFFEHVALKAIQLRFTIHRDADLAEFFEQVRGLDVLVMSFALFIPIVVLLAYVGTWIARKIRPEINAAHDS